MPNEHNQAVALSALNIPVNGGWSNDHNAWTLLWVSAGDAAFDPGLNLGPLKLDHILVVPAGNLVGFKTKPETPLIAYTLVFFPANLPCSVAAGTRVLLQNASQGLHDPAVLPAGHPLLPLLQALVSDQQASVPPSQGRPDQVLHACPCTLVSRLNAIIEELLRTVKGTQNSNGDISKRVTEILSGLQQKELQSITIDDLARRCGCSRRHLARLLREQCGDSLSAIVNGARLEKAAELLLDPNSKIVDVAPDCGFNHLGAFSKRFRERFGLTPAAWRKQQRGLKVGNGVPPETAPGKVEGNAKPEPAKAKGKPSHRRRSGVKDKTKRRSDKSNSANGAKTNAKWAVRKVRSSRRSKLELNKRPRRKRR